MWPNFGDNPIPIARVAAAAYQHIPCWYAAALNRLLEYFTKRLAGFSTVRRAVLCNFLEVLMSKFVCASVVSALFFAAAVPTTAVATYVHPPMMVAGGTG